MPNHLVHGIVPSNVLANNHEFSVRMTNGRGVKTSGARKRLLSLAQAFHGFLEPLGRNSETGRHFPKSLVNCGDGGLSAKPAT